MPNLYAYVHVYLRTYTHTYRPTKSLVEAIESDMEDVLAGCRIPPEVAEAARKVYMYAYVC